MEVKPTHIIVPLKEIEDKLELYQKAIKEAALDRTEEGKSKFIKFTGKYYGLNSIFQMQGKAISLSKKDIEEKAHKFVQDTTLYGAKDAPIGSAARSYYETELRSYKQALKDLL